MRLNPVLSFRLVAKVREFSSSIERYNSQTRSPMEQQYEDLPGFSAPSNGPMETFRTHRLRVLVPRQITLATIRRA